MAEDVVIKETGQGVFLKVSTIGPQGKEGKQGVQGKEGPQGKEGIQGIEGKQGAKGDTGNTGKEGAAGPQGIEGKEGPEGKEGKEGVQGTQGVQGTEGKQGPAGESFVYAGTWSSTVEYKKREVVSASNEKIYISNTEPNQNHNPVEDAVNWSLFPIVGPQGPEGKQGIEGKQGKEGVQGKEGKQGPAGHSIFHGTGTPSSELASVGDFYIDELNDRFYGPKTSEGWGSPASYLGYVPTLIEAGEIFRIPQNRQVLWVDPLEVEGTLEIEGKFIEI